jgi:hypothetical protein
LGYSTLKMLWSGQVAAERALSSRAQGKGIDLERERKRPSRVSKRTWGRHLDRCGRTIGAFLVVGFWCTNYRFKYIALVNWFTIFRGTRV